MLVDIEFVSVKKMSGALGKFEVHWNNHAVLRMQSIINQSQMLDGYIDGFTDGVLIALGIDKGDIYRRSRSQGTVINLHQATAFRLAKSIDKLYGPLRFMMQDQ